MPRLLAVGAGYSVRPILSTLQEDGWDVLATTRDAAKAERLRAEGLSPVLWAAGEPLGASSYANIQTMIISVGPPRGKDAPEGCPVLGSIDQTHSFAGTHIIYLSSTGVYGDTDGEWIDETAPTHPGTARGRRRLNAEQAWRDRAAHDGATLTILRLAGIYGPGRNAVESLMGTTRGQAAGLTQRVIKPGQVFNRIHRDDIAATLLKIVKDDEAPAILNLADDEPAPPQDVIEYAARLLNAQPPPEVAFDDAELSPMARSFYADNKRLKNDQLKAYLGGSLAYPTYREGLDAIAASLKP